jgi:hypothetical protein
LERHESGITTRERNGVHEFMTGGGSEEPRPKGDRAVVAKKRGNARGVKGGRKVETLNERVKENSTVMSNGLSSVKSKSKYANLRL